jgi:superfamily II DNA/RNA helicase
LGANKKALIFTESRETQKHVADFLSDSGFSVLTYNGNNTRDYETIDKFQSEAEILVATDIAAEGLNLEFCSLVVNYDLLYNTLEIEQRITRCHRQGQENDVIVLSFLQKDSYGDRRTLEIANKRLEQFQGIIGMSDKLMGNFGADILEVIRGNARHKDDIQREFADVLSQHRDVNEALVDEAESVLFTSFTTEVAKSVMVTPKYIAEKTEQINADLWEIVKQFLSERGYIIDETVRTATLLGGAEPTQLFYYWTGTRNSPYGQGA